MKLSILAFGFLTSLAFTGLDARADDSVSAPGHTSAATNVSSGGTVLAGQDALRTLPLTIELWARLINASNYNVLIACDPKPSSQHWEIYTQSNTGYISVYMGGQRGNIDSETSICDNAWHYVAVTLDKDQVSLYVDGKMVKQAAIVAPQGDAQAGDFAIGQLVPGSYDELGCNGLIQDVRISSGVRSIQAVPTAPFKKDSTTIALWPFSK